MLLLSKVTFLALCTFTYSKMIEIHCPSMCKCDIFAGFRRATCLHHNFFGLDLGIPSQTEFLDLSYNKIAQLDDHVFHEYNLLSLRSLNISNNVVSQVHMNAFQGLTKLKTLDLSANAMQYILLNWFWSLTALEELYLHHNAFVTLASGPIVESRTLRVLDMSHCAIPHVSNDGFIKTPSLETIDLSGNQLTELEPALVRPLPRLAVFAAAGNALACSALNQRFAAYCAERGIRFDDPCRIAALGARQFERMELPPGDPPGRNSWTVEAREASTAAPCRPDAEPRDAGALLQLVRLSPGLFALCVFLQGVVVGAGAGYLLQARPCRLRARRPARPLGAYRRCVGNLAVSRARNPAGPADDEDSLVVNEVDNTGTTPVALRKFPTSIEVY